MPVASSFRDLQLKHKSQTKSEEFDRNVFESIVEKVIVGGYDDEGNADPSMITFVYKTGFEDKKKGDDYKPPRRKLYFI